MGLHFKGEKAKKKSKSSKSRSHGAEPSASSSRDDPDAHLEGWIPAPSAAVLLGPSYLTLPATEAMPAVCVATNPTTGKVYPFALPATTSTVDAAKATSSSHLAHLDPEELEALVDPSDLAAGLHAEDEQHPEPSDVHHVWVCARVPDTNDRVTFRSGRGKFLASDELGRVSAEREARGMQEEWTLEEVPGAAPRSGRLVIKSAYGKYLSVDVVAGGKVELRADETQEGETERWKVMMQGEYVVKAKKQYDERNGIKTKPEAGYTVVTDLAGAEVDAMCVQSLTREKRLRYLPRSGTDSVLHPDSSKFHHHGQGSSSIGTAEDKRKLKQARKEGKLAEAMLDRRMKLKRCVSGVFPLSPIRELTVASARTTAIGIADRGARSEPLYIRLWTLL